MLLLITGYCSVKMRCCSPSACKVVRMQVNDSSEQEIADYVRLID